RRDEVVLRPGWPERADRAPPRCGLSWTFARQFGRSAGASAPGRPSEVSAPPDPRPPDPPRRRKDPLMPRPLTRRAGPGRWPVLPLRAAAAPARAGAAAPPDPQAPPPSGAAPESSSPPKALTGDDARKVAALNRAIGDLWGAGQFAEAVGPARQVVAVCEK